MDWQNMYFHFFININYVIVYRERVTNNQHNNESQVSAESTKYISGLKNPLNSDPAATV